MFDENEEYVDEYYENHKDEKEVIEGYTVQSSVNVGNRRIIYAKDETETTEMPYMKCVAYENLLFTRYENGVISDNFEEIMKLYADEIRDAAMVIEQENEKRGASHLPPFQYSDLISDKDKNLVGKVVAIRTKYLLDGYKTMPYQLFLLPGETEQMKIITEMHVYVISFIRDKKPGLKDMRFSVLCRKISFLTLQRQRLKS